MTAEKLTAEQHRERAAEAERRVEDSWERSDTDGFLSQWANGITAQEHRRAAEIVENGGKAEFTVFFRGDELVPHKWIETRFGSRRVTLDADGNFENFYSSATGPRSNFAKDGLREGRVLHPAVAKIEGRGTGLSGTAWVATKPVCEKCDSFLTAVGIACRCGHITAAEEIEEEG